MHMGGWQMKNIPSSPTGVDHIGCWHDKVFQGENTSAWNYILSMTVLTLLPVTLVFSFLQKFITTDIATTGLK
jgi:ABC-type maltose transport system permease subunit